MYHLFSFVYSVAESDSADAESGFEDQDPSETGSAVIRIVSRFIDRVCNEGNRTYNYCLFFLTMQIDVTERVFYVKKNKRIKYLMSFRRCNKRTHKKLTPNDTGSSTYAH